MATATFKAEIKELMNLIAHSMYSDQEVFLRELISNGADALQKMKLAGIKDASLYGDDSDLSIYVDLNKEDRTITIRDTGIGMTSDEVIENLGTVAKSGTKSLLQELKSAKSQEQASLIGQFGVGFYSAFVVADKVTVKTLKAGSDQAVQWQSDGVEKYQTKSIKKTDRGTEVILHLREGDESVDKFLEDWQVRQIITNWSNHIMAPVMMPKTGEGEEGYSQVNDAQALWTLPTKEIKEEDYQKFYQMLTHDFNDALVYEHKHIQSVNTEFTSLLFVPKKAPMDLYFRDYSKKGLKLYVQRVFIMDEAEQFLPSYLRFVKGVIDCEDLPLNVSREILQTNPKTKAIKASITKNILKMLTKLAKKQPEDYKAFWSEFGAVMKEGAAQDFANKDLLMDLLRFSDQDGSQVSLQEYVANMKSGQDKIYYLVSDNPQAAKHSPHIEKYRSKGFQVFILTDRVDPFLMNTMKEFDGKSFHNVAEADDAIKDEKLEKETEKAQKTHEGDIKRVAEVLSAKVSDVKFTSRLVNAPSSIVAGKDEITPHMHRLMKESGQPVPDFKPVLELNPQHGLVKRLLEEQSDETFGKIAKVLFDQALMSEGGAIDDPNAFIQAMNELIDV
ncbi:MAG: molecular chaperone HtpG [Pseudomonadota bacterium]|nr:molecular chaperone HtpG [Pseudomonadota bacterium]